MRVSGDVVAVPLKEELAEFDLAVEREIKGRAKHIAASAEQEVVADRVVSIVRVMDGLNRFRFRTQPGMLAAWKAASRVRPDRPGEAEAPDDATKVA
ncbi:MAG: hypothetical protein H0U85_04290 [Gemmatimonadales bacterium]|nr:hypothetical protein [Gemmatimonadales bacterium]